MGLLKATFNILNHWRGVIEDDVEKRGDEPIQQVETLTDMPRVAILLATLSACDACADRTRLLQGDAEREDFLDNVGTRGAIRLAG